MRPVIILAFVTALSAQSLPDIPARADARSATELRAVEVRLLQLAADPAALHHDPFQMALVYSNLGVVYADLGEAIRAESSYLKARTLLEPENANPVYRQLWARTLNNLASMYLETGQYGKAERILALLRPVDLPEGDDKARIRGTEAGLHRVLGHIREAESAYLSLLEYWQRKQNHGEAAVVMNNLGAVALDRGDPRTGAARFREAMELWNRSGVGDHPTSLVAATNYGSALFLIGKKREARDRLHDAMLRAVHWHGPAAPITAQITAMYAAALEANGDKKEARRILAEAKSTASALAPADPAAHTIDVLDLVRTGRGGR
jgi:tetratricopeptide (TPR) repeat protein